MLFFLLGENIKMLYEVNVINNYFLKYWVIKYNFLCKIVRYGYGKWVFILYEFRLDR